MAFRRVATFDELWDVEMTVRGIEGHVVLLVNVKRRHPGLRGLLPSLGNAAESTVFAADCAYLRYAWMGVRREHWTRNQSEKGLPRVLRCQGGKRRQPYRCG
jgi:hypothetical protein